MPSTGDGGGEPLTLPQPEEPGHFDLQVGIVPTKQQVIIQIKNMPLSLQGDGWIGFSPAQARSLAADLNRMAASLDPFGAALGADGIVKRADEIASQVAAEKTPLVSSWQPSDGYKDETFYWDDPALKARLFARNVTREQDLEIERHRGEPFTVFVPPSLFDSERRMLRWNFVPGEGPADGKA